MMAAEMIGSRCCHGVMHTDLEQGLWPWTDHPNPISLFMTSGGLVPHVVLLVRFTYYFLPGTFSDFQNVFGSAPVTPD